MNLMIVLVLIYTNVLHLNVFCNKSVRLEINRISFRSSHESSCSDTITNSISCQISSRASDGMSTNLSDVYDILADIASTYFVGRIIIGTPAQEFFVDFDMGSNDLWVPSINCFTDCGNMSKYNSELSHTYIASGTNFSIEYDDSSSASGIISIDTINLGGYEIKNQTFGECTSLIGMNDISSDGILGLAYPNSTFADDVSIFFNLWNRSLISKPIFSFYINPDENSTTQGELIFGEPNPNLYTNSITYTPVVINRNWEFKIDSIYAGLALIESPAYAVIDTSTTFIIGPTASINALNIALGASYDSIISMYRVDCQTRTISSFPNVTFNIANQRFILTPLQYILILPSIADDYACFTIFVPLNMFDSNNNLYWLLGNYFLYRFYSIFDMSTYQVGLAMSVSYNWTGYIDPILFNNSLITITTTTTQISMTTVSFSSELTYASTSDDTMKTTSIFSSNAVINKNVFVNDMLFGSLQIFLIFFVKII